MEDTGDKGREQGRERINANHVVKWWLGRVRRYGAVVRVNADSPYTAIYTTSREINSSVPSTLPRYCLTCDTFHTSQSAHCTGCYRSSALVSMTFDTLLKMRLAGASVPDDLIESAYISMRVKSIESTV